MSKKKPLVLASSAIAVILLAGGGYFGFTKLQKISDSNMQDLETTGDMFIGPTSTLGGDGALTEEEMQPTIKENLTPTKKIFRSLQKENVNLNVRILRLQEQIEGLEGDVDSLEEYKATNERFAPKRLKDEMADIERQVKSFLLDSSDAERFSVLQVEIMAAASALEYKAYVIRNRLRVNRLQRDKLAIDFLPGYAFCVGDGIELAANNIRELELIASKFRGTNTLALPPRLQRDLDAVVTPCQNSLRGQLDKDLESTVREGLSQNSPPN